MRRPERARASAALEIRLPHDPRPLALATPPGGWSPQTALDTAVAYADAHAGPDTRRRTIKATYAAILRELPAVKHAEIVDRLHRVDILADYFLPSAAADPDPDATPF